MVNATFTTHVRIRKIDPPLATPYIFERLGETRAGKFYTRHLKKHPLLRSAVQWLFRNLHTIYASYIIPTLVHRKEKRWRPIVPMKIAASTLAKTTSRLAPPSVIHGEAPRVFPPRDQTYLNQSEALSTFPEIYVSTFENVKLYGATNFVISNHGIIVHDLYDFRRDRTSEELHRFARIDAKRKRARWLPYDQEPETIDVAASFVDACALNYAHWITEVLPRLILFCDDDRFKNVPIVVNDGLHKNILESLSLVVGSGREIVTLPAGRALNVGLLYLTSVTGYVPFDRRRGLAEGHSHGLFSPLALERVRHYFDSFLGDPISTTSAEKVFLKRRSRNRSMANQDEVERLLTANGFSMVEPETMSFLEQIALFRNAKAIVAPTGAALCNAIFCRPGTEVSVLMAKHENMIYRYWNNMLAPFQIRVNYVLGEIVENRDLGIHGNFVVDAADVASLLEALKKT